MAQTFTQNVKINFNTDTNAAKQQIQSLYDNLQKLSQAKPLGGEQFTGSIAQIQKASQAASELTMHLQKATNVNTGKLNLKTFTQSLNQSGQSLSYFRSALTSVGPEGTRTFSQLAQSIMMAERPLFSFNSAIKSLGTTLLNSAKWQISSMAIHGIMGAAQKATGHIKALNSSLNDIRIVSGQSAEAMDKFAQKANKMAKELNTTTTAYTDAALIFYQQGLDDSAVEERVNTVIKMANVTGEAAEEVSSYMTAVWNNFDDGTKSLEYYSDAMTALGAATASSTAEIAAGLEKFAAIADTVGLSYEYATAALATVVAETRQSADVVGTAFKTMFSRLESLQLGENLDDGTTLNKYSQALATVGVNIKDQSGQLKDMDQILDELGNKWQLLNRDQQVALAQTVAGTRQYTQLISLMENYETFKENVNIAETSSGTLQQQADIYAESWEGASKRVQTAAENIYEALLDDDLFIGLNNVFASFLNSIGAVIEGMGGLKGVLPALSTLLLSVFGTQISAMIDNMSLRVKTLGVNFYNMFHSTKKLTPEQKLQQEAGNMYVESIDTSGGTTSSDSLNAGQLGRLELVERTRDTQNQIVEGARRLSGVQKELYEQEVKRLSLMDQETIAAGKHTSELERQIESTKNIIRNSVINDKETNLFASKKDKTTIFKDKQIYNTIADAATTAGVEDTNIPEKKDTKKGKEKGYQISDVSGDDALKIKNQLLDDYINKTTASAQAQGFFKNELQETNPLLAAFQQSQEALNQAPTAENIEKNSQSFGNLGAEIDRTAMRLTDYRKMVTQSGKTVQQHFGPSGAKAFNQYELAIKRVQFKYKDLQKAEEGVKKAQTALSKTKDNTPERTKAQQALTNAIKTHTRVQGEYNQQTDKATAAQNQFEAELQQLEKEAIEAGNALKALGYDNINPAQFIEKLNTLGWTLDDFKEKLRNGDEEAKKLLGTLNNAQTSTFGQKITSVTQGLTGLHMAWSSVQSLGSIFNNEDLSTGEKITSLLMSSTMLLSSFGMMLNLSADGKKKDAIATKLQAAADKSHIKILSSKAVVWAAANPWLAAFAVVAALAVAAVIYTTTQAKADEKATKSLEEKAKATQAVADAQNKEAEANKDLMKTYEDAKKNLDDTFESKLNLQNSAIEVARAYGIEEAAILALSGAYDELDKKLRDASVDQLKKQVSANKAAGAAKGEQALKQLEKGKGWLSSDGNYKIQFKPGDSTKDEWAIIQAIEEIDPIGWKKSSNGIIEPQIDYLNPYAMKQYHNDLLAVTQRAAELDPSITNSEIYKAMLGEINELDTGGISDITSIADTMEAADTKRISLETMQAQGFGDAADIKNSSDYNKYVASFTSGMTEYFKAQGYSTEKINELINNSLKDMSEISPQLKEFYNEKIGFEGLAKTKLSLKPTGEDKDKEPIDVLEEYYQGLTESEKKIFWSLPISTAEATSEIDQWLEDSKSRVEQEKFTIQVETSTSLLDLIKDGINEENIDEVMTQFQKLVDEGLVDISEEEFMGMSTASQIDYLTKIQEQGKKQQIVAANNNINHWNSLDPTLQKQQGKAYDDLMAAKDKATGEGSQLAKTKARAEWWYEGISRMEYISNQEVADEITEDDLKYLYEAGVLGKGMYETMIEAKESGTMGGYSSLGEWLYQYYANNSMDASEKIKEAGIKGQEKYAWYTSDTEKYGKDGWMNIKAAEKNAEELYAKEQGAYDQAVAATGITSESVRESEQIVAQGRRDYFADIQERLGIDNELLASYTNNLKETNPLLAKNQQLAEDIALANIRMNKGIENLAKNWEDYSKIIKTNNKFAPETKMAFDSVRQSIADVLNIEKDMVSDNFITDHYDLIKRAAEGSIEAIEQLQDEMATDIILGVDFDPSKADEKQQEILDMIQGMSNEDIEIGATLDDSEFANSLYEMMLAQGKTAEEMQATFDALGWEPEIEYVEITSDMKQGGYVRFADGTVQDMESGLEVGTTIPVVKKSGTVYRGTPKAILNKPKSSGSGSKEKKKVEDESERYHEIEREIEALERETSRLAEAKDLAFGASKVAIINQETEALQNELEAMHDLNKEIETYLAQDKANIAQFGATFDERGNISNYDELIANAVAQYNSGAWSEEKYEAFKKYLEQYEETLDKWYDHQDDLSEKQREIVEKRLEGITVNVEVNLELSEDSLEYLEYQLSKIEDEAFAAADAIALITEQIDVALKDSQTYQEGLASLEELAAKNLEEGIAVDQGGWTSDMIDQAREYKSALLETNQQLEEYRKTIEEKVTTALDEMNEKLDEQISRFDTYGSILGHYTNILGLSGKSIKNSSLIIDLGNKTVENSINKLEATRHKQEVLEQSLVDAQAQYEAALARGDSKSAEYWKETVEDITLQVEQGKEAVLATFEETLQTAADTFAAAVEQTVAVLSASLTQYSSLEQAQDRYDKQKEVAERFLDINTKNYELSKMMRNINAEIDKTDNLAAKTKLRDVLEEINEIQANNAELTQYDLDMLNAKYQLRLAEIALEEAQNAKSQVRLTQTAGGGWGYVYTADQEKVDQAEQNYEDKLYEMQKLSQDRITELSDSILANQQEMNDALANLRAEDFEDYDAYLAELDHIRDYYLDRDKYLHEQLGIAVEDSGQKYADTIIGQIENADSWEEAHQNVADAVNEAIDGENGMVSHYNNWKEQVSGAYKAAGESEDGFKTKVETDLNAIITKSGEVADSVETMAKDYATYIGNIMATITTFQTQYGTQLDGVIAKNEETVSSFNEIIAKLSEVSTQANATYSDLSNIGTASTAQGWDASSGNDNGPGGYQSIIPGTPYSGNITSSVSSTFKKVNGINYLKIKDDLWIKTSDLAQGQFLGGNSSGGTYKVTNIPTWQFIGFDTGGYTGEWGSEGRMAMLHEKEIVLNKVDTANLLASVEIVRSIAQSIDAISQYQRIVDLISIYGGVIGNNAQQLEQNVHITADFPNVTDHNEIEEAFNNLINYSSQYMNRYR